jgi:hypothetical protein
MTALAAGLALIPLAIAGEKPGNEIQTPMATVILCGLLSSTALNMIVVPALFVRFGRPAGLVAVSEDELFMLGQALRADASSAPAKPMRGC